MIKKLSVIIASLSLALSVGFGATAFAATAAQTAVCGGAGLTATSGNCNGDAGSPTVDNVLATAINILSAIAGIAAVVMIMIGGLKYITAGGEPKAAAAAKTGISHALIGLLIAAMAQILVHFVLYRVTSPPTSGLTTPNSGSCASSTSGNDPACQQPSH